MDPLRELERSPVSKTSITSRNGGLLLREERREGGE